MRYVCVCIVFKRGEEGTKFMRSDFNPTLFGAQPPLRDQPSFVRQFVT